MVGIIRLGLKTANLAPAFFPHHCFQPGVKPLFRSKKNEPVVVFGINSHKYVDTHYHRVVILLKMNKVLFQHYLKEWRHRHGLLQKEAAIAISVNLRTYQSWEGGFKEPGELAMETIKSRMNSYIPPGQLVKLNPDILK